MKPLRISPNFRVGTLVLLTALASGPSPVRAEEEVLGPVPVSNKTVEFVIRDMRESIWYPPTRRIQFAVESIGYHGMAPHYTALELRYVSGLENAPEEIRKRWQTHRVFVTVNKKKPETREGLVQLLLKKSPMKLYISAEKRWGITDTDHVDRITVDFRGRKNAELNDFVKAENELIRNQAALVAARAAQAEKDAKALAAATEKANREQADQAEAAWRKAQGGVEVLGIVLMPAPPREPKRNRDFTYTGQLKDLLLTGFFPHKPAPKKQSELLVFVTPTIIHMPSIHDSTNSETALASVNVDPRKIFDAMDAELFEFGTNAPPSEIGTATIAK